MRKECENNQKSLFEKRLKWCRKSKTTMTAKERKKHTHQKKLNKIKLLEVENVYI